MFDIKFSVSVGSLKRYRNLMLLIVLFLILTVVMLGGSSLATHYFADTVQERSELAAQQGTLIEQISKNLIDTDLYISRHIVKNADVNGEQKDFSVKLNTLPQDVNYRIEEVENYRNQFEQTLKAFEQGGKIKLANNKELNIKANNDELGRKSLEKIRIVWNPLSGMLDNYLQDVKQGYINANTSAYLAEYISIYNQRLLMDSNHFAAAINQQITKSAGLWQIVQLLGIVVAFLLFGLIVFGALRHLADNDRLLEIANREMGEIMSSVREGLFLVDKDFVIGHEYSSQLEQILDQRNLGGKNFLDVLAKLVPQSELETTKTFVEQLYNEWVVENLIEDLNPLHRISVVTANSAMPKYLDFKFFRVFNDEVIERVLVNVVDSTETVLLQSSLEAQKEQEKRELEMLNTILNTDTSVLDGFIRVSKRRLDEVNTALKAPETGQLELKTKVNYIARCIHSIKGEASALHLGRMVDICNTIEDTLTILRKQSSLNGQDFLGMVVLLEDLYRLVDILENYSERLNQSNQTQDITLKQDLNSPASVQYVHAQGLHLKRFVADIAERTGKKVALLVQGFDQQHQITSKQWQSIQDIAVQILRNSIVHGIETPPLRKARHKSETGRLKLAILEDAETFTLIAEDDGNGIDFDAIRRKAVELGQVSASKSATLTKNQLLMLMLGDGFTTLEQATEDGGKGIGMGIIKDTIHKMGGKMNIATAPNQYTRFSIKFPKTHKS